MWLGDAVDQPSKVSPAAGARRPAHNRTPLPSLHATVYDEPYASMATPPKTPRPFWHAKAPDGSPCVYVTLKCGAVAVMDAADWERITDRYGASPLMWMVTSDRGTKHEAHHVYASVPDVGILRSAARVARLIARPRWGDALHYHDHDPLNLRRSNLRVGRRNLGAYRNHRRRPNPPTQPTNKEPIS